MSSRRYSQKQDSTVCCSKHSYLNFLSCKIQVENIIESMTLKILWKNITQRHAWSHFLKKGKVSTFTDLGLLFWRWFYIVWRKVEEKWEYFLLENFKNSTIFNFSNRRHLKTFFYYDLCTIDLKTYQISCDNSLKFAVRFFHNLSRSTFDIRVRIRFTWIFVTLLEF